MLAAEVCSSFAAAASFHSPVTWWRPWGATGLRKHRTVLQKFKNIDLEGLEERHESKTFAWGGRYFDNMNERETLFTELGVVQEKPPRIPQHFADSEYIFLANTHPAVQIELLSHFPQRKLAVADTMDLWINIALTDLQKLLKQVDGVVLNNSEAEQLTGIKNPISACRKILEMGPRFAVSKKGEHGAIMVHQDGLATIPAFPAEMHHVIDPTGAGDSFAGGLMGYLASAKRTDFEAIQTGLAWGTITASFTIESFGLDRLAQISRKDIDARMRLFQAATRVG